MLTEYNRLLTPIRNAWMIYMLSCKVLFRGKCQFDVIWLQTLADKYLKTGKMFVVLL